MRNYDQRKINENVDAEIFQTCLDEARDAFEDSDIQILELPHNTQEHLDDAVLHIGKFIDGWVPK